MGAGGGQISGEYIGEQDPFRPCWPFPIFLKLFLKATRRGAEPNLAVGICVMRDPMRSKTANVFYIIFSVSIHTQATLPSHACQIVISNTYTICNVFYSAPSTLFMQTIT